MTVTTKLRKVGTSTGVILPKELLDKIGLVSGDQVSLIETCDGVKLAKYDPEFEEQWNVACEVMREYDSVLKKLAE